MNAKSDLTVRQEFLESIQRLTHYWSRIGEEQNMSRLETCEGLVHSIFNIFDGTSSLMPAIDLCLAPHESDKEYHIGNGEDYYESGMVINECMLHEEWAQLRN